MRCTNETPGVTESMKTCLFAAAAMAPLAAGAQEPAEGRFARQIDAFVGQHRDDARGRPGRRALAGVAGYARSARQPRMPHSRKFYF